MTAADPRDGLHGLVARWRTEAAICGIGGTRAAYKACADELETALAHARPEAVDADTRRLDALEADVAKHGPLTLHNGEGARGVCRGLGLSNTGRTLRQALDPLTPDQSP